MSDRGAMAPLARAATWRILGTGVTGMLVYLVTRRWDVVLLICGFEFIVKALLWFVHVRAWDMIRPPARQGTPFVLWFTGLSGSGKSTIADRVHDHLTSAGYRACRLDGDTVRSIFPDTGFTRDERNSHIKRVGYLASILEQNGVMVICSFVSPYIESRDFVRGLCSNFIEVFVSASLEECERRDVKGLYRRARAGEIRNFTGIDDPYEPPLSPELTVVTENRRLEDSVSSVMARIREYL